MKQDLCAFELPLGGEYPGKTICQVETIRVQKFVIKSKALIMGFEDYLLKFDAQYKARRCGKICEIKLIGFYDGIETVGI